VTRPQALETLQGAGPEGLDAGFNPPMSGPASITFLAAVTEHRAKSACGGAVNLANHDLPPTEQPPTAAIAAPTSSGVAESSNPVTGSSANLTGRVTRTPLGSNQCCQLGGFPTRFGGFGRLLVVRFII